MSFRIEILIIMCITCLLLSSCKVSQWYPVTGATIGAASTSFGGPLASAGGAAVGYAGGKTAQMMSENKDLKETVTALTHGDVDKLVEKGLKSHASGFEEFTETIKKILTVAGSVLLAYLFIPVILARRTATKCAKEETQKHMTRAPFPPRHDEKY